jgi:hypothetical protein
MYGFVETYISMALPYCGGILTLGLVLAIITWKALGLKRIFRRNLMKSTIKASLDNADYTTAPGIINLQVAVICSAELYLIKSGGLYKDTSFTDGRGVDECVDMLKAFGPREEAAMVACIHEVLRSVKVVDGMLSFMPPRHVRDRAQEEGSQASQYIQFSGSFSSEKIQAEA